MVKNSDPEPESRGELSLAYSVLVAKFRKLSGIPTVSEHLVRCLAAALSGPDYHQSFRIFRKSP